MVGPIWPIGTGPVAPKEAVDGYPKGLAVEAVPDPAGRTPVVAVPG